MMKLMSLSKYVGNLVQRVSYQQSRPVSQNVNQPGYINYEPPAASSDNVVRQDEESTPAWAVVTAT
jgi:hypothetical protein